MNSDRPRAFLDTNVLLAALRGDAGSRRLFSPEAERAASYVVNSVILQELLLASGSAEGGGDLGELAAYFEVIDPDLFADTESLTFACQPRNRAVHVNDLITLGSARDCDVLITRDQGLLGLGEAAEVATATPEDFLAGLRVPG